MSHPFAHTWYFCPFQHCGRPAKTQPGLVKHLCSAVHALALDAAAQLAQSVQPSIRFDEPPRLPADYLTALIQSVVISKSLPKVQSEHVIRAMMRPFMPEILSLALGWSDGVAVVADEFPVRLRPGFQSRPIDQLVFRYSAPESASPWAFLEFKTDFWSVKTEQLDFCAEILDRPMDELLADVRAIKARSPFAGKYRALEAAMAPYPPRGRVDLIYLTPVPLSYPELGDRLHVLQWRALKDLRLTNYSAEWDLVRKQLLPLLCLDSFQTSLVDG